MSVKLKSFSNRFTDEQRDELGSILYALSHPLPDEWPEDQPPPTWENMSGDARRMYRHRAMQLVQFFWREQSLDELLKTLAGEQPMWVMGFRCVQCGATHAGRAAESHNHGCAWVRARRLLGDELE